MVMLMANQISLDDFLKIHYREFQWINIAPNDNEVLLVLGNTDVPYSDYSIGKCNRSIWKLNVKKQTTELLCSPKYDAHNPVYSPSGTKIAYLSRESGDIELWIMNNNGKEKVKITNTDYPGKDPYRNTSIVWSSDSKLLAYTTLPNGSYQSLLDEEKQIFDNKINIQVIKYPKIVWSDFYQRAISRLTGEINLYNIITNEKIRLDRVTGNEFHLLGWYNNSLIVQVGVELRKYNVLTGKYKVIYNKPLNFIKVKEDKIIGVTINRDGIIDIVKIIDETLIGERSISLNLNHLKFHDLSNDDKYLAFTYQKGVSNYLALIDIDTGEIRTVTDDLAVVNDNSHLASPRFLYQKNNIIFPYGSVNFPTEIYMYNVKEDLLKKITGFNDQEVKQNKFPTVEVVKYISDEFSIESLLVLPKNYQKGNRYPTLVYLHGGPESLNYASFSYLNSARGQATAYFLASHGYVVLLPNFRGSNGYGEKFKNELGDYNLVIHPYEDLMAGIDFLINEGIANPNQLGIYGSSFGALVTAWTITQTNRFKAAIGMVGLQYDMLHEDRKYGKPFYAFYKNRLGNADPNALWTNPEVYKKLSPIEHIKYIRTPFLFIDTGEMGSNQATDNSSLSFFNGLLAMGVDTGQIYYPTASHNGGWNDTYKKDYMLRLLAWFDHYIKGENLPSWFWDVGK